MPTVNPQTVPVSPAVTVGQSTLLHATSALKVNAGAINVPAGVAGDSALTQVLILKNAGPATLTIAGFLGEDGSARNVVLTGSTTADSLYIFAASPAGGLVNTGAAMTLTASVADVVLVSLRPA